MLTIGIAGGSGSGKTTISKFLADGLIQSQFRVNDPVLREKNEEIANEYLDLVRHRHDLYVEPTRW
jgi:dephospho-CoA kinase